MLREERDGGGVGGRWRGGGLCTRTGLERRSRCTEDPRRSPSRDAERSPFCAVSSSLPPTQRNLYQGNESGL